MAQPPTQPIMARGIMRAVPFICLRTFNGVLGAGGSVSAEFDTVAGFADPNQFNNVGAFPSGAQATHAVGPFLDAGVFCDVATSLLVEFAIDRACAYRTVAPASAIAASTFENISGLRITARFVRVTLTNTTGGASTVTEFGIYVRSV